MNAACVILSKTDQFIPVTVEILVYFVTCIPRIALSCIPIDNSHNTMFGLCELN